MSVLKKVFIFVLSFIFLNSCAEQGQKFVTKDTFKPRAYRKQYFNNTPAGDGSYDQGFMDGCQTFTSVIGSGLARIKGPKYDAQRMVDDPWYLRGFQDAATYCTLTLDWETH